MVAKKEDEEERRFAFYKTKVLEEYPDLKVYAWLSFCVMIMPTERLFQLLLFAGGSEPVH